MCSLTDTCKSNRTVYVCLDDRGDFFFFFNYDVQKIVLHRETLHEREELLTCLYNRKKASSILSSFIH